MEYESKQKQMDHEKRMFKDQVEEIKKLEMAVREKSDEIEEMELNRYEFE